MLYDNDTVADCQTRTLLILKNSITHTLLQTPNLHHKLHTGSGGCIGRVVVVNHCVISQ